VVLYGCETSSLTLREEHRPRVFENRVLRGMFGPSRDEVTRGWKELHNLYTLPSIIMYGCNTWSLTLKEEHRPRVFENTLRRRRRRLEKGA
jgi:hypothetical protein